MCLFIYLFTVQVNKKKKNSEQVLMLLSPKIVKMSLLGQSNITRLKINVFWSLKGKKTRIWHTMLLCPKHSGNTPDREDKAITPQENERGFQDLWTFDNE